MNKRFITLAAIAAVFAGSPFAQDAVDPPVVVTSPGAWSTLRSDSLVVSIQADTARMPRNSVDFKVVKRSGARSQTLFTKRVDIGDQITEAFLGRVRDVPLGGADFLSIEWNIAGTPDVGGKIEPVGVAKLRGEIADNKWVSALTPLKAVRLKDGPITTAITDRKEDVESLNEAAFEAGGIKFSAGWNNEGIALRFVPIAGVAEVEFAFDLKCGKNAFLAWADRFVVYDAKSDSLRGLHYGNRSVVSDGMKQEERAWGDIRTLNLVKDGDVRIVTIRWHELGIQPFDGRNIGFAVFPKGRANLPSGANRQIPGTWGEIRLEK